MEQPDKFIDQQYYDTLLVKHTKVPLYLEWTYHWHNEPLIKIIQPEKLVLQRVGYLNVPIQSVLHIQHAVELEAVTLSSTDRGLALNPSVFSVNFLHSFNFLAFLEQNGFHFH